MKSRHKRARRQRRRANRRSITWVGPALRLPKILSVSYDDVTLFAGRMT